MSKGKGLDKYTKPELVEEVRRLREENGRLIVRAELRGEDTRYSHLTGRERSEAIRESNQRAGGDPYGG